MESQTNMSCSNNAPPTPRRKELWSQRTGIIISVGVILSILAGISVFRQFQKTSTLSACHSLGAFVCGSLQSKTPNEYLDDAGLEWKVLPLNKSRPLLTLAIRWGQVKGILSSLSSTTIEPMVDQWGKEFSIQYRREGRDIAVRIVSSGRDCKFCTDDDIVGREGYLLFDVDQTTK